MNMKDHDILNEFAKTRNLGHNTRRYYKYSIEKYTKFNQLTLQQLLNEAEKEEQKGIRWKDRKLKKRLLNFRTHLYENLLPSTAKIHFNRIITIYHHYEIEIHKLPQFNEKNLQISEPISFQDLPDKKIILQALKITTPVMRAIILFMSSSGCARRETLDLTIQDFIKATGEYHNSNDIYEVINQLYDRNDVIPQWKLKRKKTNKYYFTFSSPESTSEIIHYLISEKRQLKPESRLFKTNENYLSERFNEINNKLQLGKSGTYNRFRPHMLRKFHASRLYNDNLSLEEVDALQGRSKNETHTAYFMEDQHKLKEKYIQHLNAITINMDVNNLDIKSPDYIKLENELKNKKQEVTAMDNRLSALENVIYANSELIDIVHKFKK